MPAIAGKTLNATGSATDLNKSLNMDAYEGMSGGNSPGNVSHNRILIIGFLSSVTSIITVKRWNDHAYTTCIMNSKAF